MNVQFKYSVLSILFMLTAAVHAGSDLFPVPEELEGHLLFWESIFTEYATNQIVFHDSDHPERIYSVLAFDPKSADSQIVRNRIRQERNRIRSLLLAFARNPNPKSTSEDMNRIRVLFRKSAKTGDFKRAASRIRIQGGMREKFQAGLERAGRYEKEMRRILREYDVPEDLVYLPHVESSFNPLARSRAGASGIWQFTYKTGKRYLYIRSTVDERRDPLCSSEAAAKLLRENYRILKSWPLAITAYNHGPAGVKRAVRKTGSRDIGKIAQKYRSRRFGFASRNFYAEFLAARRVAQKAETYFPGLFRDPEFAIRSIRLSKPKTFSQWASESNWPKDVLAEINPALSSEVLFDQVRIPARTNVNVPANTKAGQQIALALGTSIYWASNSEDDIRDPVFQISGAVAHSVKTQVRISDPIMRDSIRNARYSGLSDSGSVQDLIAWAYPEEPVEISQEDIELSPVIPDIPSLNLDLDIRSGDRIVVQPEETLGHYADWLGIPTWKLRQLNRLRYGQSIRLGQNIRLTFQTLSKEDFRARREAYHREIRSHFFLTHEISDVRAHVIRPGENFWTVANDSDNVPLWLMLAFNQNNSVNRLKPGDRLHVPIVTTKRSSG